MNIYSVDFETYYDDKFGIKIQGSAGYVEDELFDPYLLSVAGSDGFEFVGDPKDFDWTMLNGQHVVAHNASFDQHIYNTYFKTTPGPAFFDCTADLAAFCALPRSLAGAVKQAFGRERDKTHRDRAKGIDRKLMAQDEQFRQYALDDAKDCLELWMTYSNTWPEEERRLSRLTREMGWRGLQTDVKYVESCRAGLLDEYISRKDTIPWANDKAIGSTKELSLALMAHGIPVPKRTAQKDEDFQAWLEKYGEKVPFVQNLVELRQIRRCQALFDTIAMRTRDDGVFPYDKLYFGGHTGRFSGGGGFNMENLNQKDRFGTNLRRAFIARPGKILSIADFSQIEPRVLNWLAGDFEFLDLCRSFSPYLAHGIQTGRITDPEAFEHDRQNKDSPEARIYAGLKAEVLLLGYGGGWRTYQRNAKAFKIELDEAQSKFVVDRFRGTKPKIVALWRDLENQFRRHIGMDCYQYELLSGRWLTYWNPRQTHVEVCGLKQVELQADTVKGGRKFDTGDSIKRIYGGLLTENCFTAETLVLTPYGTRPIASIKHGDFVWDGTAFVKTDGAVCSGSQPVVSFGGVRVTPDHPVHTSTGWKRVKDTTYEEAVLAHARSFGDSFWLPGSNVLCGVRWKTVPVGSPVRLRNHEGYAVGQAATGQNEVVRVRTPGGASPKAFDAQDVQAPGLCRVGVDATEMQVPGPSGVPPLRRSWNHGRPEVVEVCLVLGGYGSYVLPGVDAGADGQQQGVQPGKLQVGDEVRASSEHQAEQDNPNSAWTDAPMAGCGSVRDRADDPSVPAFSRGPGRANVRQAGHREAVYDLLNCGPNHRFTVFGPDGRCFTAHNCTQAVARDILRDALLRQVDQLPQAVPLLTVHDEVVSEMPEKKGEALIKMQADLLREVPAWIPGLPLDVDAKLSAFYKK